MKARVIMCWIHRRWCVVLPRKQHCSHDEWVDAIVCVELQLKEMCGG